MLLEINNVVGVARNKTREDKIKKDYGYGKNEIKKS